MAPCKGWDVHPSGPTESRRKKKEGFGQRTLNRGIEAACSADRQLAREATMKYDEN
jgi:hypothetical protein